MTILDIDGLMKDYEMCTIRLFYLYRSLNDAYNEKISKKSDLNLENIVDVDLDKRIIESRNKILRVRQKRDEIERVLSFFGVSLKFDRVDGKKSYKLKDFAEQTKKLLQLYRELNELYNERAVINSSDSQIKDSKIDEKIESFEEQIYLTKEKRNEAEEEMAYNGESYIISVDSKKLCYPKKKKIILKPKTE